MQTHSTKSLTRTIGVVLQNPLRALSLAAKKLQKPAIPENSSFCYVREDEHVQTVIYLYNYWSENYKIEKPQITFELITSEGNAMGKYPVTLEPNGSATVRVADIISHVGAKKPFEGSVLATIASPNLVEGRPLQMNVDYFHSNGKRVSGVHSQWGLTTEKQHELLASFHVVVDKETDTHVVLRNTLSKKSKHQTISPKLILTNHSGKKIETTIPPIPPHGMARVNVRELFPDAQTFLEGKAGNLEVSTETIMGRCLFYHHNPAKNTFTFDHATQHHGMKKDFSYTLEEMQCMGIGPVAVGPVRVDKKEDTYILPFVDFLGEEKEYAMDLSIFDQEGKRILHQEKILTLHPSAVPRLHLQPLLEKAKIALPFHGSFQLSMHASPTNAKFPRTFHIISGYSTLNQVTEYQFDSGLFNMPENNLSNEYQTTKIFSRIMATPEHSTLLCLINASGGKEYARASSTQIAVFNTSGQTIGEKTIVIPPRGCAFVYLSKEFPNLVQALSSSGGNGSVKVRDRTARIVGPHIILDQQGEFQCTDHLVGG